MAGARVRAGMRIVTALIAAAGLSCGADAAPRAVIELFTSQGCSSCPPADALLAKLAREPDLITLSLPVDYWDRLGWKDTLAKHAFTERQVAYSKVRGDGEVYTPQAVVNGREHAVGSQRSAIDAAIADTSRSLTVPLEVARAGDDIVVSVSGAQGQATPATLVLLPIVASRQVAIGRGENARRTVTYTNIVGDILPLGDWSGAPLRRTISANTLKGYDGLVVLLQTGSPREPGAIIGAGRTALR